MNEEELKTCLESLPAVRCALAYGSGVLAQYGQKNDDRLVDLMLVVEDSTRWHAENLERNGHHYSALMRILGPKAVEAVQRANWGGKMYFNTSVALLESKSSLRFKYGVIDEVDAVDDLVKWEKLYFAGRLHKPVRFISKPVDENLRKALEQNLINAMHCSLLLLPENFTNFQLYETITALSYTGDVRMGIAENPNKVSNIVKGSFDEFENLYAKFVDAQEDGFSGRVSRVGSKNGTQMQQNIEPEVQKEMLSRLPFQAHSQIEIRRHLRKVVSRSSTMQSAKGLLTAGIIKAAQYGLRKLKKRF